MSKLMKLVKSLRQQSSSKPNGVGDGKHEVPDRDRGHRQNPRCLMQAAQTFTSHEGTARCSVVGVELVVAFRAGVEDGRPLIGATQLGLAEHHLRIMALGTLLDRHLLRVGLLLRNLDRVGVQLAAQGGREGFRPRS